MIFIVVKFTVKPEHVDTWLDQVGPFTRATRAEPGNLWFDWSRSVEVEGAGGAEEVGTQFVLVEAFQEGDAPARHVQSDHFKAAMELMPPLLVKTPEIVSVQAPGAGWGAMGEMSVPPSD